MSIQFTEKLGPVAVGLAAVSLGLPWADLRTALSVPDALAYIWLQSRDQNAFTLIRELPDHLLRSGEVSEHDLRLAADDLSLVPLSRVASEVLTDPAALAVWAADQLPKEAQAESRRVVAVSLEVALGLLVRDEGFRRAITAGLIRSALDASHELPERVGRLDNATEDQLRLLGHKFAISGWSELSVPRLRGMVRTRVRELGQLTSRIAEADDRSLWLADLKIAAKDAIGRLDFAETDRLLLRASQIETEIMAATKELRARNALLTGGTEAAFRQLSAVADAFADIDIAEPGRKRRDYARLLHEEGQRHGGEALPWAIRMSRDAVDQIDRDATPELWAETYTNLGDMLLDQLRRIGVSEMGAVLSAAVDAYNNAITAISEFDHPMLWGKAQNHLGNALLQQGILLPEEHRDDFLKRAQRAYRRAGRVILEETHPMDWAQTQQNLAVVLVHRSKFADPGIALALLGNAAEACENSVRYRDRITDKLERARLIHNLGMIRAEQGRLSGGITGVGYLDLAIDLYDRTLAAVSEDEYPDFRAELCEQLCHTECALAENTASVAPRSHLVAAQHYADMAMRLHKSLKNDDRRKNAAKLLDDIRSQLDVRRAAEPV
ncbi:hypothetical protein [Paracoccus sp. (in: a-proteobacteria)]|uniref:hypothetical protein n=1 Tax=Paracoccus sp. TaxID=267 RepID=UPI003A8812DA